MIILRPNHDLVYSSNPCYYQIKRSLGLISFLVKHPFKDIKVTYLPILLSLNPTHKSPFEGLQEKHKHMISEYNSLFPEHRYAEIEQNPF